MKSRSPTGRIRWLDPGWIRTDSRSFPQVKNLGPMFRFYVRQLSPEVAALTPTLEDEMQGAAMHTLRYADEVLDPAAPRVDRAARLHGLGVVARSLLTVVEMTAEYEARQALDGTAAHR
ncbi:hypothetical protein AB0L75_24180 [Streptomyces sp. NPDC052101]|uniref:hypothetical protein n=1 Tax=Streptomyces sp. NPDC052101 TaxID=3155763 RepID=UPI003420EEA7